MVLSGAINKEIVHLINAPGRPCRGPLRQGRQLMIAEAHQDGRDPDTNIEHVVDLGFVGEPERSTRRSSRRFARADFIPVIAPIGVAERARPTTSTPTPSPARSPAR